MTSSPDKFHVDYVKLESLTILKASIDNRASISAVPKGASSDIQFQLIPGVNWDLCKVRMVFDCTIKTFKDETNSVELGVSASFEIAYVFLIENLHKIAVRGEKDEDDVLVTVPPEMVSSLSNIAYSTSRGVIYTRCLGTVLGPIVLPVLSTDRILGENV